MYKGTIPRYIDSRFGHFSRSLKKLLHEMHFLLSKAANMSYFSRKGIHLVQATITKWGMNTILGAFLATKWGTQFIFCPKKDRTVSIDKWIERKEQTYDHLPTDLAQVKEGQHHRYRPGQQAADPDIVSVQSGYAYAQADGADG